MRSPSKDMALEITRAASGGTPMVADAVEESVQAAVRAHSSGGESRGTSYGRRCAELLWRSVETLCSGLKAEFQEHRKLLPLALAQMLMLADQPLLSVNMTKVAKEWSLDNAERDEMLGGVVSVMYFSCGAVSLLLAGRMADVMKRINVVRIFMVLGALGTFCNSLVGSFACLLLCRGAAGAALGGLLPASYAMLADMYPAEERPHAIALIAITSGAGISLGQTLAVLVGASDWRKPFAVVGAAGFLVSILLFVLLKEPVVDAKVTEQRPENSKNRYCGKWVYDLRRRTVILVCLQGITGCVPWATVATFMTDYLAENGGLGTLRATGVCLSFGIGCFGGTAVGGKLGQNLYKKDKRLQAVLMSLTTWGGTLPLYVLFSAGGDHAIRALWILHLLAFSGGLMVAVAGGNAKAILLNTVPQKSRGSLFGIYTIMDDLGKGLGPALVASWVRAMGRTDAFKLGILFWLPCGLFCLLMTCTILRDDLSEFCDAREFPMAEINSSESSTRASASASPSGSQVDSPV